eukprot:TRINITY_DN880_c0_g8_i1.p1 TRINITY_DN880_c0_g8~~TRINITY_DN880_c0_g8_i1.p1  ORF type:complete len:847 (+),score=221.35 TRINITY_DN880_c0_g8_i1:189-2729(+)
MQIASLEQLGNYDVVCVSPHLDDAAFSCGTHLRNLRREGKQVLVVSVFTAAPAGGNGAGACEALAPYLNLEARLEEDHCAMKELGVDYHYMDLAEVLLRHGPRGRSCFSGPLAVPRAFLAAWASSNDELEQQIAQRLQQIVSRSGCGTVLSPAGIGYHPDHLLVHEACTKGTDGSQLVLYYDFPYCSYSLLAKFRRWALDMKYTTTDVEVLLTAEQVAERKRLLRLYTSQVGPCFGTEAKLDATADGYPVERFVEVQRPEDAERGDEEEGGSAAATARALTAGALTRKGKDSGASKSKALLQAMVMVDLVVTIMAAYWMHHKIDWDLFSPKAMKSAYTVALLGLLRAVCLLKMPTLGFARWLCVSTVCMAAAAFSFTAGVRCLALATYYTLQVMFGYAEQSVASLLRGTRRPAGQPMRVLVVSDYMPPQTHGISTHTNGLVTALRNQGCLVHVYTTTYDAGQPADETMLTWSVKNPFNPDVRLSVMPSPRLLHNVLFGDWDVVHIIFPSTIAWLVLFAAWIAGKPTYASQHCSETLGKVYVPAIVYYIALFGYTLLAAGPTALWATMNAGPTFGFIRTNTFMKHYSPDRVAVVPSSVDAEKFHARGREADRAALLERLGLDAEDSRPLWLLVSRLAPEKDVMELLGALRHHVQQMQKDAPSQVLPLLVVAGDGPLRPELEEWVRKEKVPVRFLGFVRHKEVGSLYRACDVCATNSVHETFGLTVIESLACGCPMVMPHCEVFDELYGDVLGDWMYTKGDVTSLVAALRRGSTAQAREHLAALRRDKAFNPNLFWSWADAADEQVVQYRRCHAKVHTKRRFVGLVLRNVLLALSIATMVIVLLVYGP